MINSTEQPNSLCWNSEHNDIMLLKRNAIASIFISFLISLINAHHEIIHEVFICTITFQLLDHLERMPKKLFSINTANLLFQNVEVSL